MKHLTIFSIFFAIISLTILLFFVYGIIKCLINQDFQYPIQNNNNDTNRLQSDMDIALIHHQIAIDNSMI